MKGIRSTHDLRLEILELMIDLAAMRNTLQRMLERLPDDYPDEMKQGKVAASLEYQVYWTVENAIAQASQLIQNLRDLGMMSRSQMKAEWDRMRVVETVDEMRASIRSMGLRLAQSSKDAELYDDAVPN